ncbi:hypothetical protein ACWGID_40280 [Kribbella sp. NPDC054772]
MVVALHGAGQTVARAPADWEGVLDRGYALVCVQSSRRMSPNYRTWPDPEQAAADIARGLAELPDPLSPATIWIGADDDLLEVVDDLGEQLTALGCTIERIPGLGHTVPSGFDDRLAKAL